MRSSAVLTGSEKRVLKIYEGLQLGIGQGLQRHTQKVIIFHVVIQLKLLTFEPLSESNAP